MKRLKPWMFNVATLVVVGLIFVAQGAVAKQDAQPAEPLAAPQMVISYQGTLTDANGNPVDGYVDMVFALHREATGGTPFWTESYSGAQAVMVANGQFQVLLGSQTPLDSKDISGDLYLGITINSEEMMPRETLVSVPSAINASSVRSFPRVDIKGDTANFANGWPKGGWMWLKSVDDSDPGSRGSVRIHIAKDLVVNNTPFFDVVRIQSDGGAASLLAVDQHGKVEIANDLTVQGLNIHLGGSDTGRVVLRQDGGRTLHFLPWGGASFDYDNVCIGCGSGDTDLIIRGNVSCGGLTEANLQTADELAAGHIDRFEEGDVLCWAGEKLEKCSRANDRLVQAVSDREGRPIVIGAEVIKVLGPVRYGDLLVAAHEPGYATVNNDPRVGTVIAQALEDFDGERGLVKAMIRKF